MLNWGVRSASRCAKSGVMVFKASMLNCQGVHLQWHCPICETTLVYRSAMGICALCTI